MAVENYLYTGPTSGYTLDNGEEKPLFTGKTYPFDTEHPYTKVLKRMRYLKPVPASEPAPEAKQEAKSATETASETEQEAKPANKPKTAKKKTAASEQPDKE